MTMEFCPFCEKETRVERIEESRTEEFRGETITSHWVYYRCPKCGEEFFYYSDGDPDPYEEIYTEYERRTGINPRYKGIH